MREEMSFEEKKANAIKLLEKYKFNEEVLQVYRDLKEDDERFMKCYQLDDLSDKYNAEYFEVCLTWEESGM